MNEKYCILIVDDSLAGRNVMDAILKPEGYHIEFAANGREALEKSFEMKPDLVLLDVILPDMDGFKICRKIRSNPYTSLMPVIMVTALDDRDSKIKGLQSGADEFLSKPLDALEVRARVATILKLDRFRRLLYDRITGLPNEILLMDYIDNVVIRRDGDKTNKFAVLAVKLSNSMFLENYLSKINDRQFINAFVEMLQGSNTDVKLISYSKEGCFTVLLSGVGRDLAAQFAEGVVERLKKPIPYLEGAALFSCKIGISLYPANGSSGNELVTNARLAFNEKQLDPCQIRFYDEEIKHYHRSSVEIAANLYNAVEKKEFVLHFQPQVRAVDGKIMGMEALLRWDSSKYGFVFPEFFIHRAEENGTIMHLGNWVMMDSMRYLSRLSQKNIPIPEVSINVSALQFADPNLEIRMMNFVRLYGVNPQSIKIEITEGSIIADPEESRKKMLALKAQGFKISIDDFGTGYASLTYLKYFPADEIKIDKDFIQNMENQKADYAIVKHIIELAHTLNLRIVAEGVENENQLELLKIFGCDVIQGYFFSKPVGEKSMIKLLLEQPFVK